MAGSSVAVEHVLAGHLVDHGFSSLEGFEGSSLVAGSDELAHLLDGGAVLAALGACELAWYWPFVCGFLKISRRSGVRTRAVFSAFRKCVFRGRRRNFCYEKPSILLGDLEKS